MEKMAAIEGGYECEFVEQPPKLLQSECPVCHLVLRNPCQVSCCGNSYCERCIKRIKANKQPCPTCEGTEFHSFPDKRLQRALNEFKVRCTYRKDGCEWVGELSQLDRHLNSPADLWEQPWVCQFAVVQCLHCHEPFQRRHVIDHQDNHCTKRLLTCEYCHKFTASIKYIVSEHLEECPAVPVPCPNKCGAHPKRQNVKQHEDTDCPLAYANCDFHFAKCPVRLLRKDMGAHLAESLTTHVSLLSAFIRNEEDDVAVLRNEFENQQSRCEYVMSKISDLEEDNYTLKTFLHQQSSVVVILKKEVEDMRREIIDLKRKLGYHMATELPSLAVPQPIDTINPQPISAEVLGISPPVAPGEAMAQMDTIPARLQTMIDVPLHDSIYIVPITFTFKEYEEYKEDNDTWLSPGFYTHPQGYLMCLSVDANGYGNGMGTHLSVYVCLMRGKYDDSLKWPFIGDITVQLVNQLSEEHHHTEVIKFTTTTNPKIAGRVSHEGKGYRKGHSRFVSHSMRVLGYEPSKHRLFLRNNTLQFRVKNVIVHSTPTP